MPEPGSPRFPHLPPSDPEDTHASQSSSEGVVEQQPETADPSPAQTGEPSHLERPLGYASKRSRETQIRNRIDSLRDEIDWINRMATEEDPYPASKLEKKLKATQQRLDDAMAAEARGNLSTEIPFPTTAAQASELAPIYGIERKLVAHILEYERAGRNLNLFSHQLSRQEKRPVLTFSNPRTAALMQAGFRHWLANFPTQEKAQQFVTALTEDGEYAELLGRQQVVREELREALRSLANFTPEEARRVGEERSRTPDMHRRFDAYTLASLPDPLADIRVELFGLTDKALAPLLHRSFQVRDQLRAHIFAEAGKWIGQGELPSFVYPVNHFKVRVTGPTTEKPCS